VSLKIVLCIFIVFLVSFSVFFLFNEIFPNRLASEVNDNEFFHSVEKESRKVLILGGSGSVQLNSTLIDKKISNFNPEFSVYNLSYNADTPEQRFSSVESTLDLKPEIVFYALTYFDLNGFEFDVKSENQVFPDVKHTISKIFNIKEKQLEAINPKATTMNFLKDTLNSGNSDMDSTYSVSNSPFSFIEDYQTIIAEPEKLIVSSEKVRSHVNQDENSTQKQKKYLRDIIEKFLDNNIQVVIFSLPHHQYYLEHIPENDKEKFYSTLAELEHEYGIQVYDFQETYGELEIWQDSSHIAFHEDSMIFSNDVADMILREVKKNVI